ncbi:MAG: hypothetical protein IPH12_07615 [Saprospirales bacterium]|nr:hypothetical protein [Saprospirales bacterium]MBK8920713.1 hypothetical protein [Saprospirales bacterium]
MADFIISEPAKRHITPIWPLFAAVALSLLCLFSYDYLRQSQPNRVKMEKSSGKNGKHSNPKARQSAEKEYQKAKEAWQKLKAKTNKSAKDKKLQQELEKRVKHLEKKKTWKGEQHSQKHKGN